MVRSSALRTRVLVADPNGDLDSCSLFVQAAALDEKCFRDFRGLMQDLCRKARSGLPLAPLFGADWRELRRWQVSSERGVMTVSSFLLTHGAVGVLGFMPKGGDVVLVGCAKKGRQLGKAVDVNKCCDEAERYCIDWQSNNIEYLPRSQFHEIP